MSGEMTHSGGWSAIDQPGLATQGGDPVRQRMRMNKFVLYSYF